jgi:hypothetical protein
MCVGERQSWGQERVVRRQLTKCCCPLHPPSRPPSDIIPPLNAAGFYDTFRAWFLGLMQGLPKGRLLKYDPATKEAHVISKV